MIISQVRLLAEAVGDLDAGKTFYDRQQPGVGDYFWDSLLADVESLLIYAGVHSKLFGCYRMLAKRFPYAIYYQIDGGCDIAITQEPGMDNKKNGGEGWMIAVWLTLGFRPIATPIAGLKASPLDR